jgi:hypothetical protein
MTNCLEIKFKTWGEWLMADDPNSCNQVIGELLWDRATASVFDVLAKEDTLLSVALVNNFAARHYFQVQTLRIRRLADGGSDVSSLARIIKEMRDASHIINRQNLLQLRNVEDLATAKALEEKYMIEHLNEPWFRDYKESLTYKERIHNQCDNLFYKGDKGELKKSVLSKLDSKLKTADSIAIYVNKMVAHSVIPSGRQKVDKKHLQINYKKIDKAIEELVGVFNFLTLFINENSVVSVPLGWDMAVEKMTKEQVDIVSNSWKELSVKTEQWRKWGTDLLAKNPSYRN